MGGGNDYRTPGAAVHWCRPVWAPSFELCVWTGRTRVQFVAPLSTATPCARAPRVRIHLTLRWATAASPARGDHALQLTPARRVRRRAPQRPGQTSVCSVLDRALAPQLRGKRLGMPSVRAACLGARTSCSATGLFPSPCLCILCCLQRHERPLYSTAALDGGDLLFNVPADGLPGSISALDAGDRPERSGPALRAPLRAAAALQCASAPMVPVES